MVRGEEVYAGSVRLVGVITNCNELAGGEVSASLR